MEKVLRVIDRMSEWTGKGASFLVVFLTLFICYDVFMRYVFAKPSSWVFDMTYMIYGSYAMLGTAFCHYAKGHVRMDLVYSRLSKKRKALVDAICYAVLFFPLLGVMVYKIGGHALWSFTSGECASGSSWRPPLGPFKGAIVLGLVLFLLQGIVEFIRSLQIIFGGESHES